MKTESRLLVVEMVIPPNNEPSVAKLMDLEMLIITGGRDLIIPTKESVCIIEGIRVFILV